MLVSNRFRVVSERSRGIYCANWPIHKVLDDSMNDKSIQLGLFSLQQRGSLMSEWVIPFEELNITGSPLGSGRFGKVYRLVGDPWLRL